MHDRAALTAAIVLAAGASSRLGRPKQLLLYEGEPLLRRAVRVALASGIATVLVVTTGSESMAGILADLPVTQVRNPTPEQGMNVSLRLGMDALNAGFPAVERVLLLVCDQPLLRREHLQALLEAPGSIAAAQYNGRLGVPAVFAREHFPALAAAPDGNGDHGARTLLRTLSVTQVPMPEAAFDVDTPEDLIGLEKFERDGKVL